MELPKHCGNCEHFDGDAFCTLKHPAVIAGFIREPKRVMCVLHERKTKDET
jgi:hypothetical protein